jgi:hypothetical protein
VLIYGLTAPITKVAIKIICWMVKALFTGLMAVFTWVSFSGIKNSVGKLSLVLNNPYIKEFADSGQWIGNYYVMQGVFAYDNLIASCAGEASCIKQLTQAVQVDGRKKSKVTN